MLEDIGVRPIGVKVPITWQSVALGDEASVEPAIPELYQRWLCDLDTGSMQIVLEIPLQLDRNSIRIAVTPG
jgi:hypothetical protein